jgi:hypothetical protein
MEEDFINIDDDFIPVCFLSPAELLTTTGETELSLPDSRAIDFNEQEFTIPRINFPHLNL